MKDFIVIIFLLFIGFPTYSYSLSIPMEIISKFFKKNNSVVINRVPFKLNDLEGIFNDMQPENNYLSRNITMKYLDISYPNGYTNISEIINSTIPVGSKETILSSSEESVLLTGSIHDLCRLPLKHLNLIKIKNFKLSKSRINAEEILQKIKMYSMKMNFGVAVNIKSPYGINYSLSSPNENHKFSEVMDKTRGNSLVIDFINFKCNRKKCYTDKLENYFLSFRFSEVELAYTKIGKNTVNCQYEGIYYRKYPNINEVEVTFTHCKVLSFQGSSVTNKHPVLKKIYPNE